MNEIREDQAASRIQFRGDQMQIDGKSVPQLFGAELQYFRMRGGYGRNIPREKVRKLWSDALDRMVEAGMNAICFYIPWDFHEYKEAHFDFTGSADEDGDGNADYPSRDVIGFLKLIEERGIKHIMVRPGPYINAEWGFLGFGAIPSWFHRKHPEAHMMSPKGHVAKLFDYHNEELLKATRRWFTALHSQVLKDLIGPGKPIFALQVDNETNYQWQSLHNVDFSPKNVAFYRSFLEAKYKDLAQLNAAHGRQYRDWSEVKAPTTAGLNVAEDADWYRFQDHSIFVYLQKIQSLWHELGVTAKDVLFTLAESYNAPKSGLIPNFDLRNDATTGMYTVNLYPKTDPNHGNPLLNNPFKTDHDVRMADASSDRYFLNGEKPDWVLGPEIQGGWWRGCEVKPESRQQTYLTVLGHGMKAIFLYYFVEGDNWDADWEKRSVRELYDEWKLKREYAGLTDEQLSTYASDRPEIVNRFWAEISNEYRRRHFFYNPDDKHWAQWTMLRPESEVSDLFFDTPLDRNITPRPQYFDFLKQFGSRVIKAHGEWLGAARELTDDVVFLKASADHAPQAIDDLDNVFVNTDWSAGLYAYGLHAGYNAKVVIEGNTLAIPANAKSVLRFDYGRELAAAPLASLRAYLEQGGVVVNFLESKLLAQLGLAPGVRKLSTTERAGSLVSLLPSKTRFANLSSFLPQYARAFTEVPAGCESILKWGDAVVGVKCAVGRGAVYQVNVSLQDIYNSNNYYHVPGLADRTEFLRDILSALVAPKVRVVPDANASKVVTFAREGEKGLWITVKSGHADAKSVRLQLPVLPRDRAYTVEEVLSGRVTDSSIKSLRDAGIPVELKGYDSKVFFVRWN